jgi:hypothetical protein
LLERQGSGQVGNRQDKGEGAAFAAERRAQFRHIRARIPCGRKRFLQPPGREDFFQPRMGVKRNPQKRRMIFRPLQRILKIVITRCRSHATNKTVPFGVRNICNPSRSRTFYPL